MSSSTPWSRARSDLRVSDAEREHVARLLRDHAAEGRLTPEELDERVGRAYRAVRVADLQAVLADLPGAVAAPRRIARRPSAALAPLAAFGALAVIMPGVLWLVVVVTVLVGVVAAAATVIALGVALTPAILIATLVVLAVRRQRGRRLGRGPLC